MADDRGLTTATSAEMIREARELIAEAESRDVTLRLLGGAAIAIHCDRGDVPHREFSDLDCVARRRHVKRLLDVLRDRGYQPDERFNAVNAGERLIFSGPAGKLDIFVDDFEMCHRIELHDRLELDSPTLSVTDLLLTKLQVVEMNRKDLDDLRLLLDAHAIGEGEGDHVNGGYLAKLLGGDWGLWKTVGLSLERIGGDAPHLRPKLEALGALAERAPRSLGFKMRARIGERARWYLEPEE